LIGRPNRRLPPRALHIHYADQRSENTSRAGHASTTVPDGARVHNPAEPLLPAPSRVAEEIPSLPPDATIFANILAKRTPYSAHNSSTKVKIKTSTDFGITSVLAGDLCCCSTFQHHRSHKGGSSMQCATDRLHSSSSISRPRDPQTPDWLRAIDHGHGAATRSLHQVSSFSRHELNVESVRSRKDDWSLPWLLVSPSLAHC